MEKYDLMDKPNQTYNFYEVGIPLDYRPPHVIVKKAKKVCYHSSGNKNQVIELRVLMMLEMLCPFCHNLFICCKKLEYWLDRRRNAWNYLLDRHKIVSLVNTFTSIICQSLAVIKLMDRAPVIVQKQSILRCNPFHAPTLCNSWNATTWHCCLLITEDSRLSWLFTAASQQSYYKIPT